MNKMNLTKSDFKSLGLWGVAGLGVSILYKVGCIFATQRLTCGELTPKTETIQKDVELFSLFFQLQSYRGIDEVNFTASLNNADKLLHLEYQLRTSKIKATVHDRPSGYILFKHSLRGLEDLLKSSKDHKNPLFYVEVHRLYVKIYDILEKYWNAILRLTRDIKAL